MNSALRIPEPPEKGAVLRLHVPLAGRMNAARWLINGFPTTILTWTAEEWSRLVDRPLDAQETPNGVWCALRVD